MAWPTTPVPTTNCDADTDSPTDFRADVVQLITDHNSIVAARNAVSGIAALDETTKVPIAQLPTGTGSNQAALGDHVHTGTYEPANGDLVDHLTDTANPHAVTAAQVGADVTTATAHAASSKATPVDADEVPLLDSAASFGLKKLTWANLKATAKTYFDTLYALTGHDHAGTYATLAQGVTNGNGHNHLGGDGGTISYSSLGGLPTLGTAAAKDIAPSGNASIYQVVFGSDTRLSDARTAVSHTHAETDITDGAVLARLAANETVSGAWTFSAALTTNTVALSGTSAGAVGINFSDLTLQPTALYAAGLRCLNLDLSLQPQLDSPMALAIHASFTLENSSYTVDDIIGVNVRPNIGATYTGAPPRWIGLRAQTSPVANAADSLSDAILLYYEGNAKASGTVYGSYWPFVANAGATKIPLYHTGGDYSILTEKVRLGDTTVPTEALEVAGNALAKQFVQTLQTITDATSMTWDCDSGAVAKITLTGGKTRTLNAPTHHKAGGEYTLILKQGAATQLLGTWNAAFKFAGGVAPTLTATNGKTDVLRFVSDGTSFFELSRSLNL